MVKDIKLSVMKHTNNTTTDSGFKKVHQSANRESSEKKMILSNKLDSVKPDQEIKQDEARSASRNYKTYRTDYRIW